MIILLISERKEVYENTKRIVARKYDLIWHSYDILNEEKFPETDVVIVDFGKHIDDTDAFEVIIKIKGKLGHMIPILALIQESSPQDIFTILRAGAYDYLEDSQNTSEYCKKVDELILWEWYLVRRKDYGGHIDHEK